MHPALPVPGISVILGNGLVGAQTWAEVSLPVVVAPVPLVRSQPDESERDFPEAFTACAVTRAMVAAKSDSASHSKHGNVSEKFSIPLSNFPVFIFHSELVAEQQTYPSLRELFSLRVKC